MSADDVKELIPEYLLGTLDPAETQRVEAELAASEELQREAEGWQRALFSLPESLEPTPVDDASWERLRDATFGGEPGGYVADAPEPWGTRPATRSAPALAWLRPPWSGALLAACLALVVAFGGWGWMSAQESQRLADEQRIIAYWMRHPDLAIQALTGVGAGAVMPGAERPEISPGVVCVLPDGRAMVLQPYAPPRGSRYVVYGLRGGERVELATSDQRLLLFDASDLAGVELALDGRRDGVVAQARF